MNEKFEELIKAGKREITMIAPGFSVDCLETLEEIKWKAKRTLLKWEEKVLTI